jgi:hypothetical protein
VFENVHSISRTRLHIAETSVVVAGGLRARAVSLVLVVYVYSFDENRVYEVWRRMSKLCKQMKAKV